MSFQPCLPVAKRPKMTQNDGPISFDDVQSMAADDYLSRVVSEAKRLPEVFVATPMTKEQRSARVETSSRAPIEGCAASLSYLSSKRAQLCLAPSATHLPSNPTAWVASTLDNFSRLREYLERCHEQGIGSKDSIISRLPVPPMKDRAAWHTFCVGVQDAQGNEGGYFGCDDVDDEEEKAAEASNGSETEQSIPAWMVNLPSSGYQPEVTLLLQLDQVMVRRVLSHLCYYVNEGWSPTNYQRSTWMYALLARLERPLHRDDASVLYSLVKSLLQVRSELKLETTTGDSRECLARINVLIAIVGVYFEQGGFQGVMTTAEADDGGS